MKLLLIVIALLAIAFGGMAIKVFFTKDKQLEKCCGKDIGAKKDNNQGGCACSGK